MNIKVVFFWGLAVLFFAVVGIFGYMNQDLLLVVDDTPYEPEVKEITKNYTCKSVTGMNESTYSFLVVNDKLEKVTMTYKTLIEDVDGYASASSINNTINFGQINGMVSTLTGTGADFQLTVSFDPSNYDKNPVEEMSSDYTKLLMVVDSIDNYDTYVQAISNQEIEYTCE